MFKDEYSNQLDSIRADGYIKQKIKNKITGEKRGNKGGRKADIFRIGAAIAACIAIVASVIIVRDDIPSAKPIVGNAVKSYKDIYNSVEPFIPKRDYIGNFFGGISNFAKKGEAVDDIIYEYEYAAEDMMDGEAPTSAAGTSSQNNGSMKGDKESEATSSKTEHSETNTQVKGVDEADIIKTDGKYIYCFSSSYNRLRIIKAGKEPVLIKSMAVGNQDFSPNANMYLVNDRLVMIGNSTVNEETIARIYDISNPEKTEMLYECKQSGYYNTSRVIENKLYLISNYVLRMGNVDADKPETYVPSIECKSFSGIAPADDVYINRNCSRAVYTVVCGFDIESGNLCGSQSILGGTYTLYCSTGNIITADYSADGKTNITRFAIDDGKVEFIAEGVIDGNLLNQFSIDEYKGYFRFVTTVQGNIIDNVMYKITQSNSLTVLDGELKKVSSIDDIAPDERVYSVRFMGDIAYFVTFRQVDPLFSVDLSDPKNPKIIGALKIPGFSNYLFPYGEGKLLGIGQDADENTGRTRGVKLSMFDITNPSDVTEGAKLILDADYSPALQGHKESLIDFKKNIIGFSVWGKYGFEYRIFSFNGGEFNVKAQIRLSNADNAYGYARGMYIGNEFYIITEKNLYVYDINTYSEITRISLS